MELKKISHNYLCGAQQCLTIMRCRASLTCWEKRWCDVGDLKTPTQALSYCTFLIVSLAVVNSLQCEYVCCVCVSCLRLLYLINSCAVQRLKRKKKLCFMKAWFGLKIMSILCRLSAFFCNYHKVHYAGESQVLFNTVQTRGREGGGWRRGMNSLLHLRKCDYVI